MSAKPTAGIGDDFLGYRPEELIGRGGMGVVYRARDLRLRRIVALKLMAPELAADERFRERFAREAELAMSLEHPNVVPIHDAGDVDGRLYLVMRFVEGTDLRTLLRAEGALAPRRALSIAAQVAHALDAAHAKGLVHRDVKPSNVLLDASEHVYLADFGLTRRFGEGPASADVRSLGTPAYLAPEQIEGGSVDGSADVYSLGCLLFECLTGEPPFGGSSRLAVAWAHLEEEAPRASGRNPQLPEAIDDVIRKAMAKDPGDRYAACGDLVSAAEDALGFARRSGWRRGALALAAAVIAVAALAAAFVARAGDDGGGGRFVARNTLVRVDPRTNAVAGVVDVGGYAAASAVAGDTVWAYNVSDRKVLEVDPEETDVRHVTEVSTQPNVAPGEGSAIAADREGAWIVGFRSDNGRSFLTRVFRGGRGKREYELGATVDEVVVAAGGVVWVLAHRGIRNVFIRVDPSTGTATRRIWMPRSLEKSFLSGETSLLSGLAAGGGYLWATDAGDGLLYRVDTATGAVRARDLGGFVLRPVFGFGSVWICAATSHGAELVRVHPRTMRYSLAGKGLPAEEGDYVTGYGSVWRHDVPSGTLMRFDPRTGDLSGLVHVMDRQGSAQGGLFVTSIVAGADAIWMTVA